MTGPSTRATPYPRMTDAVGNTATAIRAVAESVPAVLGLPAGSAKVALLSKTLTTDGTSAAPGWSQTFTGFTRVDGWVAAVRSMSLVNSDGTFYQRAVQCKQNGNKPLPLSGAALTLPYALSAGGGVAVPAATYVVDFLVWGV